MAQLFRAGKLRPHHGRFFACATRTAAQRWARELGRDEDSIIKIEVPGQTPCVVNTHGYVEADWNPVLDPTPWNPPSSKEIERCRIFRQEMQISEAVEILRLLEGEYDAHEIVWA